MGGLDPPAGKHPLVPPIFRIPEPPPSSHPQHFARCNRSSARAAASFLLHRTSCAIAILAAVTADVCHGECVVLLGLTRREYVSDVSPVQKEAIIVRRRTVDGTGSSDTCT